MSASVKGCDWRYMHADDCLGMIPRSRFNLERLLRRRQLRLRHSRHTLRPHGVDSQVCRVPRVVLSPR